MSFHFGGFVLDPERRELRSGTKVFAVEPQVFDLLEFLIRNRDRVVTRDDLLDGVWGGRIVSESAIAARINAARRAIGDDGREQRLIRTIARKGFRFVGDVREEGERSTAGAASVPPKAAREQRITFCRAADGVNLAVARVGRGMPLVCTPNWGGHLEYDWENPTRAQLWKFLADRFELVRYDGRGFGLSDRNVMGISLATLQLDLQAVVDALGLRHYAIFSGSAGSATAITHAASYPERLSKLIIHEGFVQGLNNRGLTGIFTLMKAYAATMGKDWSNVELGFMRTAITEGLPGLSREQVDWCVNVLSMTTSLENALRYFLAHADIDVSDRLPQVRAPTLVLNCRHCRTSLPQQGHYIATSIPNARLVNLESANVIPLPGEPAWPVFIGAIESFLSES